MQLNNTHTESKLNGHQPDLKRTNGGRRSTAVGSTASIKDRQIKNYSEAQVRLHMDEIQHATHLSQDFRQTAISVLRSRLKYLEDETDTDDDDDDHEHEHSSTNDAW